MVDQTFIKRLFLLLPLAYPPSVQADGWSYENPNNWGKESPQCNGNQQSPIHLKSSTTYTIPIPPIRFGFYDIPLVDDIILNNNGHSVELKVPVTLNGQRPFISGGLMKNKYEAIGVHFHWGSEHVINNRRFDMEMHIVHKNVNYETVAEALEAKDGLAVLGIMFKIFNEPERYYPALNKIFNELLNVKNYGDSVTLTGSLTLGDLLGDLNTKQFFTYNGSLTTPNCAEAVTWHIFSEPLPISKEQIENFWSIRDTNGNILLNNYRPLQQINERPIFYRESNSGESVYVLEEYHNFF